MNPTLNLWRRLTAFPLGNRVFSRAICIKAPYFGSIKPLMTVLETGKAVAEIKDRRAVHNHIGSVHAIALCNLAEFCAGVVSEASMPPGMRWIPAGMTVRYLARAEGTMVAEATMRDIIVGEKGAVPVMVEVKDQAGLVVFDARIEMHISPKPTP